MPPTTLKLPADLKQRIAAVAAGAGTSPHAFMVAAIERETARAEQRRAFVAQALAARERTVASGRRYPAAAVHRYISARVRGRKTRRPKAVAWRR
jgi:predicted transcriptional regulator